MFDLRGTQRIEIAPNLENCQRRALEALNIALANEQAGSISRKENRLTFRRSFGFFPYSASRLAYFNPGEINVSLRENHLIVEFRVGLLPAYFPLSLLAFGIAFILYVEAGRDFVPVWIISGLLLILIANIWLAKWRLGKWLKRCAMSALR